MFKKAIFFSILLFLTQSIFAQTILKADGAGDTYELINSVLAPGHNSIEVPDCNHQSFGRHIEEVFDSTLNAYAFGFIMHKFPDNDRCRTFDRQRNEIKAYDKSPDSLKAVEGEQIRYTWKFKLDSNFQPSTSFTHLHQIKAVGGSEASMPSITLTARKANPDRLELRYAEDFSQVTLKQSPLEPFTGKWLAVEEIITFGEVQLGTYEVLITDLLNGDSLFYYKNEAIRMWKTNADFLRPKWGIYRSLNDSTSLRDEIVLFADFMIEELDDPILSLENSVEKMLFPIYPNPAEDVLSFSAEALQNCDHFTIFDLKGKLILTNKLDTEKVPISHLNQGLYFVELHKNGRQIQTVKLIVK